MLFFRGLAPQNKPELQKVMEKRKRDQVIKQKEEEAQKKKSDLEIELLKRQQKLEQVRAPRGRRGGYGCSLRVQCFVLQRDGGCSRAGTVSRTITISPSGGDSGDLVSQQVRCLASSLAVCGHCAGSQPLRPLAPLAPSLSLTRRLAHPHPQPPPLCSALVHVQFAF